MARTKKKKREEASRLHVLFAIQDETKYWIFALFLFAIAILLLLAAFDAAGVFGEKLYEWLIYFFGIGYYLFPFVFLVLGATFIRPAETKILATPVVGALFLFLSGLGLVSALSGEGGLLGSYISAPLIALIDLPATVVIFTTVAIAALLFTLDVPPSFGWMRSLVSLVQERFAAMRGRTTENGTEEDQDVSVTVGAETQEEEDDDEGGEEESEGDEEEEISPQRDKKEKSRSQDSDTDAELGAAEQQTIVDDYEAPPLSLLGTDKGKPGVGDIKANANVIKRTLQNFGINVEMDEISVGPSVTRYALKPAQGVKLARIVGLKSDLALALAAHPIRIEAPIPGRSLVGIEIPNEKRITVGLGSLLSREEYQESEDPLLIALGRGVTGKPLYANLAKMPHMLVAGATGSGKSVAIHDIVLSLLYRNSPEQLRLIMVDPKRVELTLYNKTPHLLTPVITNPKKAILALKWATKEMERRYDVLEAETVRDIASYHQNVVNPAYAKAAEQAEESDKKASGTENLSLPERMPYIVIIIDELADIMTTYPRELESSVVRLAQMSRAVGIHLILSTQRPSVNVITGLIKANIPVRAAFQVASQTDSRTILDSGGAEALLGAGDMLYVSGEMSKPTRLQSSFVSESEIKKVVKHLAREARGGSSPDLDFSQPETGEHASRSSIFDAMSDEESGEEDEDDLYEQARQTVIETGRASTTFIQRKLRVGYARAARLMDMLEERGVVSPANGSKQREILVGDDENANEDNEQDTSGEESETY